MRIRLALPEADLDDRERKDVLDAALESVTRAATPLIAKRKVPTAATGIKRLGVRWQPEPPGDEHFDLPTTVLQRKWGDCDDLAPWHAASLRATGVDRGARAVVKKSGPKKWHAIVQRSDGSIEDPSLAAGMHRVHGVGGFEGELVGAYFPAVDPMADDRLAVALYPVEGGCVARVDMPDFDMPWSWSSAAADTEPATALRSAIVGIHTLDPETSEDNDLRLAALHDLLEGVSPYEVAQALQELASEDADVSSIVLDGVHTIGYLSEVGSFGDFFKKIGRGLGKIVKPLASFVLPAAGTLLGPLGTAAGAGLAAAINKIPMGGGGGGGDPRQRLAQIMQQAQQRVMAQRAAAGPPQSMPAPFAALPHLPQGFPQAMRPPFAFPGGFGFGGFPFPMPQAMPQQVMQAMRGPVSTFMPPSFRMEPGVPFSAFPGGPTHVRF